MWQKTKSHIGPKLIIRLRAFALVVMVIISIVIYKILIDDISLSLASLGLLLGASLGVVFGRISKILWHPSTGKVISKLDKTAVIFLLLYIVIEVGRKWFFAHWLHGAKLNAFGLVFVAGLFLGRLLAIIKSIKNILKEQNQPT